METITTTNTEQSYVEVPYAYGTLRIAGDEQVMQEMYEEARASQRQAALEAPQRALRAVAGYLGEVASNVKLEAKMAVFDALHQTNYRQVRHELIEQERRRRFEASIGIMAVGKR